MLLVGDYEGVFDADGRVIKEISRASLPQLGSALRGSSHADVTGGMASKVSSMVELCERIPGLSVRIFSGDVPGEIQRSLFDEAYAPGTSISA
jgi:isopentenyl phosphate kinase